MLTDNKLLIDVAKRNYDNFGVATSHVDAKKRKRHYTPEEQADLDVRTSVNKIGEIINLAQELNTIIWDKLNSGASIDEVHDLYLDVSKLNVLSMTEIDRAKKEFTINAATEIKALRKKHLKEAKDGRMVKPGFFSVIAQQKGYYNPKRKKYQGHLATMDFVQKCARQYVRTEKKGGRKKYVPFCDIVKPITFCTSLVRYAQIDSVIALVRNTQSEIKHIWDAESGMSGTDKYLIVSAIRQECINRIAQLKFNTHTMYKLLHRIEEDSCKDIARTLFSYLFGIPNESFFALIEESAQRVGTIIPCEEGEYEIFGARYTLSEIVRKGKIA